LLNFYGCVRKKNKEKLYFPVNVLMSATEADSDEVLAKEATYNKM